MVENYGFPISSVLLMLFKCNYKSIKAIKRGAAHILLM